MPLFSDVHYVERLTEVVNEGFTILEEYEDHFRAPVRVRLALNQPDCYGLTTVKQLEAFWQKTGRGEAVLYKHSGQD